MAPLPGIGIALSSVSIWCIRVGEIGFLYWKFVKASKHLFQLVDLRVVDFEVVDLQESSVASSVRLGMSCEVPSLRVSA